MVALKENSWLITDSMILAIAAHLPTIPALKIFLGFGLKNQSLDFTSIGVNAKQSEFRSKGGQG